VPGLHAETVNATHRIVNILVWGLGIAVAYPFIPMSDSDAFKGLSVMFGFMLTLGSAGIVNQLMSGLVLVYSRALSVGDFVDLGETVGVVSEVGALSTKIINMRNEEVTIPNAVLVGSPIKNYSRLAGARGTLVSTKVTIGYDTPWRQVHAMLIAAAEQTPGLRSLPRPFVYQTWPGRLVRRIRTVRAHGQAARTGAGALGVARQHPGSVQYLWRTDHVAAFRHAAAQ
jgi:small-conductance mechanosensitive channel